MKEKWYRMERIRSRSFDTSAWVPLRAHQVVSESGEYGEIGHHEEYFGSIAVLFPVEDQAEALACEWTNVNASTNTPWAQDDRFFEAGHFDTWKSGIVGEYLVLKQYFEAPVDTTWHLHQNFALALGLKREGDVWIRPAEDDREVVRLQRDDEGSPVLVEVRNEHLKDYLCARGAGLLLAQFHERIGIEREAQAVSWSGGDVREDFPHGHWEGRVQKITRSGIPFEGGISVHHVGRKDVDYDEDMPHFDPGEGEFESESWTAHPKGSPRYRVSGETWMNEWIAPGAVSPRVRGDEVGSGLPFIVGTDGSTASGDDLAEEIRWVSFRPTVVKALLDRPNGKLNWLTENTGGVGSSKRSSVHFGVNQLGLLNVLAKDVADLPASDQKIWAGHNCTPEGGVSRELLMSQMEAKPARTKAPEADFRENALRLELLSEKLFGASLLKEHFHEEPILGKVNRFHATDEDGLYRLAKEITRVTVERLDKGLLRKQLPDADEDLGSIKLLDQFLSDAGANGYAITGPLVGVYDLRMADAHLPSSDLSEEMKILGIQHLENPTEAAKGMIAAVAGSMGQTCKVLETLSASDVTRVSST